MQPYGNIGKPVRILEAYVEWASLQEADTAASFADYLFGPVRKALYKGYSFVAPQYRKYADVVSVPDFKPLRMTGLNGFGGLVYVGDSGDYKPLERGTRLAAELSVDTYGGIYQIKRHAIINDDTRALLNTVPEGLGRSAASSVVRMIVALIESNPDAPDGNPMFSGTPGRGNLGTADLSEDSLAAAIAWMESQEDDNGEPVVITPGVVLVKGVQQELKLRRILNSTQTGTSVNFTGGTAGVGTGYFDKGVNNPLANILPADAIVRERFLVDANDWYLLAAPGEVPAFAVAFLNGKAEPFIGLKDPNVRSTVGQGEDPYSYEFDSIDFKVRHDYGAAAIDPRGAYKASVSA